MTISADLTEELMGVYMTPLICLLKITHSSLATPLRFASTTVDIASNGETFVAYKFTATTPKQGRDIDSDIQIRMANIDPTLLSHPFQEMVRTEAPKFTLQRVRELTPDVIEEEFTDCPLVTLQGSDLDLNLICRSETIVNQPLSRQITRTTHPGLYKDA